MDLNEGMNLDFQLDNLINKGYSIIPKEAYISKDTGVACFYAEVIAPEVNIYIKENYNEIFKSAFEDGYFVFLVQEHPIHISQSELLFVEMVLMDDAYAEVKQMEIICNEGLPSELDGANLKGNLSTFKDSIKNIKNGSISNAVEFYEVCYDTLYLQTEMLDTQFIEEMAIYSLLFFLAPTLKFQKQEELYRKGFDSISPEYNIYVKKDSNPLLIELLTRYMDNIEDVEYTDEELDIDIDEILASLEDVIDDEELDENEQIY